jgi:hypothetical protein
LVIKIIIANKNKNL